MHFYQISYEWKQICFFVLDTQINDGTKKRTAHAEDIIREELNIVNAKILSYTNLKSTVGLSTELSNSLKKLETQKIQLERRVSERKYPKCNHKQH